jgi:hypothetical protein
MYIIVPSYPSIYFAIYQFYLGKNVTIITNNLSVKSVLKTLSINYIFIDSNFSYKNFISSIFKLKRLKKSLDHNKDLYLLDNVFCVYGFYISNNWNNANVYHSNLSSEYLLFNNRLKFKDIIIKYIYKLTLNLDLVYRNQNGIPAIGIDNSFNLKNSFKELVFKNNYNDIKLSVLNNYVFGKDKFKSILILQGKLTGIIKYKSLVRVFNELLELDSLVIKEHPKHKSDNYFSFGKIPKIPDHYPVEMCYGNIENNIISVFSISLVLASQMEGRRAYSLLEMVDWCNLEYKKQIKEMLENKSFNKIIFPTDILELKKELYLERTL